MGQDKKDVDSELMVRTHTYVVTCADFSKALTRYLFNLLRILVTDAMDGLTARLKALVLLISCRIINPFTTNALNILSGESVEEVRTYFFKCIREDL